MKFNREKSKQYVSLKNNEKHKIEKFGKIILTSFGIVLILFGTALNESKPLKKSRNSDKTSIEISDYDIRRGKYLEKVYQYRDEFENISLLDFYKDGKIIVTYNGNKIECNLKALYLRFGVVNNNKFIFLSNVLNGRNVDFFSNDNKSFAEKYPIIEFRNTTIFEKLYKKFSQNIVDNVITLNEEETAELISMIDSWDGKINDIIPETMAVENKQVWEVDNNEKKR